MTRSSIRVATRIALVGLFVVTGCTAGGQPQTSAGAATATASGPAPSGPPSPTAPAGPVSPSAWDTELADLAPDGTRSLESALTLFAMAFGPLPGVAAQPASRGTVGSASPAVRAIRAHRAELTAEQRQAVDGYLSVPNDAETLEIAPAGTPPPQPQSVGPRAIAGRGGSDVPLDGDVRGYGYGHLEEEIAAEAQQARSWAAQHFGEIPKLEVRLWNGGDDFLSFFDPIFDGNTFQKCDVIVNTSTANDDRFQTRRAMSLDVVHCFQSWRMGSDLALGGQMPGWAWEGAAEYVLLQMWPALDSDRLAWQTYLESPGIPLFGRTYDAVGYWSQVQWSGLDLEGAMVAVLADVDNLARFALAGTATSAFTNNWASQLTRQDWGNEWTFDGPAIPLASSNVNPPRQAMPIAAGSLEALSEPAFTNKIYAAQSSTDFVHFDYSGSGRVGDGNVSTSDLTDTWFCTNPEACGDCDDGTPLPFEWTALNAAFLFGASGGVDAAGGSVSGHSKDEFCKLKSTPQACPDGPPPQAKAGGPLALVGGQLLTEAEKCPTPTPDEFCSRYRDYIEWAQAQGGGDITKPLAAEIANRFIDMHPYAPEELVDDVEVIIDVYATFADLPDPFNVPAAGQAGAAHIPDALKAMNAYCDVSMPGL